MSLGKSLQNFPFLFIPLFPECTETCILSPTSVTYLSGCRTPGGEPRQQLRIVQVMRSFDAYDP